MTTGPDEPPSVDARDSRRWLIGVGISLVFGLFSVVMALLSYSPKPEPASGPAAKPPGARDIPSEPARRRKSRDDRH